MVTCKDRHLGALPSLSTRLPGKDLCNHQETRLKTIKDGHFVITLPTEISISKQLTLNPNSEESTILHTITIGTVNYEYKKAVAIAKIQSQNRVLILQSEHNLN